MRLFLAIYPSKKEREALVNLQNNLVDFSAECHKTMENNLHMTLAFLGEVDEETLSKVKKALHKINLHGFILKLEKVAYFEREKTYLYYAAPIDSERVEELASAVRKELTYQKVPFDQKLFVPHVTLVRDMKEKVNDSNKIRIPIRVDSVHLMVSERVDGMLTYRSIDKKELGQ